MNYRPDFSNLVAHFTKGTPPLADIEARGTLLGTACEKLIAILDTGKITATKMPWTQRKAVCFTECPFWSLIAHSERYSPYGIGFTKPHLFAASGGPAIYLRWDLFEKQQCFQHRNNSSWTGFDSNLFSFVTPFSPSYAPETYKNDYFPTDGNPVDYTHEREWRVPSDFKFKLDQVQFVMLKSYEDMAAFPRYLKNGIGRDKFILLDVIKKTEGLWPTHLGTAD
ncbi:MAG: terminase [Magnetococcales bacterium]|nr:terminase [Magnetococcales bacterium]